VLPLPRHVVWIPVRRTGIQLVSIMKPVAKDFKEFEHIIKNEFLYKIKVSTYFGEC
jgi:hypothetical protein